MDVSSRHEIMHGRCTSTTQGPTWAENYELEMAAHAWGWRKSRGDGHSHVGMAAHTWGWKVYTWGSPLTRGDGGFKPGDGHSHLGMAAPKLGAAAHTWGWPPKTWGWEIIFCMWALRNSYSKIKPATIVERGP